MLIYLKDKYTLKVDDFIFKCCIGKNGKSKKKVEGDKKTPKGLYEVGHLYFRRDKLKKPLTKLKCIEIKKNMGWCDDPNNLKYYNKLIKIKKNIKHEHLYRKDSKYDLMIPIKYNYLKPKKFKGSCIFLHLTNNYKPTAGCIALRKKDFLIMLKIINKKTKIKIN
jgi:L,D-peptidoglycan transpeptidase YkuD (ErfK/YbiS/YcfS/YnhG family)|tara:strand:+ start:1889 stop:2383 length:495 start_codon:yes stop_codon:yes gene_type:complete